MTGCAKKDDKKDLKGKVSEELDYLDTHIISIANSLNNISLENYTIIQLFAKCNNIIITNI